MSNDKVTSVPSETVQRAVEVQQMYLNGFSASVSLSDISIMMLVDGVPHTQLHMSFTTAKTLVNDLQSAIGQIEELTGNEIMPMQVFRDAFEKAGK